MDFESYYINVVFIVIYSCLAGCKYFKYKNKPFFECCGQAVKVNSKYGVGTSFNSGTVIAVDSIQLIQLAGNCISLFNKSGNAFDVWVDRKHLAVAVNEARALFPAAEYIQIND